MPRATTLIALGALLLAASANANDRSVYRWTDSEGNVFYSDRPQADSAEDTGITSKATDPTRIADARSKPVVDGADAGPAAGATADSGKAEEDPDDRAARFAENCRRATGALESIVNARRLYVPTDDGSRRYLDESETSARRAKAEADVREWCG